MPHYKGLQTEIIDLCSQDTAGDFETMTKAAINRVYRRLLQAISADELRREFTFSTTSGTSQYGMPLYVKTVLNIEDPTNDRRIYDISAREFDVNYPGDSTTGSPTKAYPLGVYGVQTQPSSAAVVRAASSSSSDATNFFVRVTGYVSGVLTSEKLTLTGTSNVSTTNSYSSIEQVTKLATSGYSWSGNITISTASETLTTIPVWWDSPRHLWYEFYPIPTSSITYTVRCLARKPDLLNNEDWPDIDENFHSLLVNGSLMELCPAIGKTAQGAVAAANFERDFRDFKSIHGKRPNKTTMFSDIHAEATTVGLRQPAIANVDY